MINCFICKISFLPYRSSNKFCSSKCRLKNQNKIRSDEKKIWNKQNKEKIRKSQQQWLEKNPQKRKEASSAYQKRNRGYYNSYASLRSRYMKQAKPTWLSEWDCFYIEELYDIASKRKFEVDHIVPIKHKRVCGLHVPWNLQLLTRSINAKKNNKFDEDIICVYKDKK